MNRSRRAFLRTSTAAAGAVLAGLPALAAAPATAANARASEPGAARNLIFLVSDGMSLGALSIAAQFRRRREGRGTAWLGLHTRPDLRRALMDTASASALVTDSAAASSAWGGGLRVANGALNVGLRGERPAPIFALAHDQGRAAGLVSTASITHATPAGFAINAPDRDDEAGIADLYLKAGLDLYLGGGASFFDPAARADKHDAFAAFAARGYAVARDRAALAAAPDAGPLLGVFAENHLPYALDHAASPELRAAVPTLAEMTELALARLASGPRGRERGFVLQVEGARIDHAAHANDFAGLVHDQLAFDDALAVALRFAEGRDDTLVVVTTDHGNSSPSLNGTGPEYGDTDRAFERGFTLRQTNHWILSGLGADATPAALRERVHQAGGPDLADAELTLVARALRKDYADAYRVRASGLVVLGQVLSNHLAVGWSGIAHTSDLVELAAFGPGSGRVGGIMLNTDLHGVLRAALGLRAA